MNNNWPEKIDLIVFDFDGVMTDNRVIIMEDGSEGVFCNRADGLGIDLLRKNNVRMLILSTETNDVVVKRAKKLRLPVLHGLENKVFSLKEYLNQNKISPKNVAYIGNDINDLECLKLVGLPVVVADANPKLYSTAVLTLKRNGGHGAVREFCDIIADSYLKN